MKKTFFEDSNQSELATLEILLRKELTHADMMYRRIGVIGASTMIKILGSHLRTNIFEMLFEAGRSQAFTQALAFDELSNILPKGDRMPSDAIEKITEKIAGYFETTYIADAIVDEDKSVGEGMPKSVLWANYDGPDADVCIPIYRLIHKHSSTLKGPRDAVRPLAPGPTASVVLLTEMRDKGVLDEVDATLGCGLRMPESMNESEFNALAAPAKKAVLLSFFVAHGWVMELINCFSAQSSPELKSRCMRRLENLIHLEDMLSMMTGNFKSWTNVLFDAYQSVESIQDQNLPSEKASSRGRKKSSENAVNADGRCTLWKSYARKLEPRALSLIRVIAPVKYTSTDFETEQVGENVKTVQEVVELSVRGLHYLLQQLVRFNRSESSA